MFQSLLNLHPADLESGYMCRVPELACIMWEPGRRMPGPVEEVELLAGPAARRPVISQRGELFFRQFRNLRIEGKLISCTTAP